VLAIAHPKSCALLIARKSELLNATPHSIAISSTNPERVSKKDAFVIVADIP